jgi:signal transduction histidine kinase
MPVMVRARLALDRFTRRVGGPRVLALPLMRWLAVMAGLVWILLAPLEYAGWRPVHGAMLAFLLYSVAITFALWYRPGRMLRLSMVVLAADLAFALLLIRLTGGAPSILFLALLLIASLQSYYYGMARGVAVAMAAAAAYVVVVWPTITDAEWANMAVKLAVLLGTAVGVGVLGQVEERERLEVAALTTERVGLKGSARQAEKLAALGTMAAGLAHELNNPIGVISSRIEIMLLDLEGQAIRGQFAEDLRVLHRHAQRVARIAQGLLSFSRQSSGLHGPVDLNHLVEETLALVERQITRQGVTVTRRLAPDLPALWGDGNTLQQVVLNLLTNARDAVGAAGEITVETSRAPGEPDAVRLVVRDTGPGIPSEALPRIFDPFFTTKAEGTGLGLSISYGIVRDHYGTVDVESREGEGTTFTLTFPVAGIRAVVGDQA